MAYQALYRQWRPQTFSQMVGQENIVITLKNQVTGGRIAHAYLFCGSRGTGKTSTAKILARAVNCLNPREGDPCGECECCRRILQGESMDIQEIDAASNNGVDQVRELRDSVQYPPQFGSYKVYIIDEVHMLSTAAFNALLKTLEEPPEHVVFILATTEPQKLPATILSRCQRFDFGRIPADLIAQRLREAVQGAGAEADQDALMSIARAAEGGMRDALSILDICLGYDSHVTLDLVQTILGTASREFLFRFSEAMANRDPSTILVMIDRLMREGKDPAAFGHSVAEHLRSLFLSLYCEGDLAQILEITEEDASAYKSQAALFQPEHLLRALDLFTGLDGSMKNASSPRTALEILSVRCCARPAVDTGDAMAERIAAMEKTLDGLEQKISSGRVSFSREADSPRKTRTQEGAGERRAAAAADSNEVWNQTLNALRTEAPFLYPLINKGVLLGVDNNTYRWEMNEGEPELFFQTITKEKNIKILQDYLEKFASAPCRFEASRAGAAQRKPASLGMDQMKDILECLGPENVTEVE